jgi:chloramphenicol 3-O-phosphotransferase
VPSRMPSRVPSCLPSLTTTLECILESTLEGRREGISVHVDVGGDHLIADGFVPDHVLTLARRSRVCAAYALDLDTALCSDAISATRKGMLASSGLRPSSRAPSGLLGGFAAAAAECTGPCS